MLDVLQFYITILARAEQVWQALWQDDHYRYWTSVFSPGSYAEGDWKEGGQIRFLTTFSESGILSEIAVCRPPEEMTFRHLTMLKAGVPVDIDEQIASWSGATEKYVLQPEASGTLLTVELKVSPGEVAYFQEHFPLALERVKEVAEKL